MYESQAWIRAVGFKDLHKQSWRFDLIDPFRRESHLAPPPRFNSMCLLLPALEVILHMDCGVNVRRRVQVRVYEHRDDLARCGARLRPGARRPNLGPGLNYAVTACARRPSKLPDFAGARDPETLKPQEAGNGRAHTD